MAGPTGRHRAEHARGRTRLRTWAAAVAGAALLATGVATQVVGSPLSVTDGLGGGVDRLLGASPADTPQAAPVGSVTAPGPAGAPSAAASATGASAKAVPLIASWRGEAAVKLGGKLTVRGTTSRPAGVVRIEQRVGRAWEPVTTAKVAPPAADSPTTSKRGTWRTTLTAPKAPSFQTYRATWIEGRSTLSTVALPRVDVHRVHTYVVTTRGKLASDVDDFAERAASIYADKRGWKQAHHRFSRVKKGGDFTLVLAEAGKVPSFDSRCSVHYSCRSGRNVIINEKNWLNKTPNFVGSLDVYRDMVVNHETGHWLGMAHHYCAGKGRQAPVMQQQSKGMQGCKANGWPTAAELKAVAR